MEYERNMRRIIIKVPELNALLKITRRALCPGFHFVFCYLQIHVQLLNKVNNLF